MVYQLEAYHMIQYIHSFADDQVIITQEHKYMEFMVRKLLE
jgi:hypothetical protein